MTVYYNDNDLNCCRWLRSLIAADLLPQGDVDDRSITDVQPSDLTGYTQCHFFAGIGGWSYALQLAGWPDDAPVWTGSCPCQPFSIAGSGGGTSDKRHLWPEFQRLISLCHPPVVFGEQVASPASRSWLSTVRSDLEALGYAVGAADLCAAGVGAPHIRQRLWWVGQRLDHSSSPRRDRQVIGAEGDTWDDPRMRLPGEGCGPDGVADCEQSAREGRLSGGQDQEREDQSGHLGCGGPTGRLADTDGGVAEDRGIQRSGKHRQQPENGSAGCAVDHAASEGLPERSGRTLSGRGTCSESQRSSNDDPWGDVVWIPCADGKARPIKPSIQPLATGVSGRVAQLRAIGNSVVPQVAAQFISAFLEATSPENTT